jgi:hypothetical protein
LDFIIVVDEAREVGGKDEAEDGEEDPRELRGKFERSAQQERGDAAHEEKKEVAEDDAAGAATVGSPLLSAIAGEPSVRLTARMSARQSAGVSVASTRAYCASR